MSEAPRHGMQIFDLAELDSIREQLAQEVEALAPLERIRVVARVRTGRAGLTGSPILDLIELRVGGGDGEENAPR